jgi:RHS repeat-associated protein
LNRLTTLTNSLTGQFGFGYDALSRRTQLTRPNGVNTNYNYDSVSHLLSVLHQAGSTTLDGASYTYDYAGNRTSKTNDLNGTTWNYGYDAIYELLQVTHDGSTKESYSYDAVGNRLSSSGVPSYSYNSSNELTSNSSGSYTYDANGNTLSDPSGKSYSWDFENRLIQAVVPGTGTTSFRYDPFGRRIQKSGPLGTTNYLYDGQDLVDEAGSSGSFITRYVDGPGVDEPLSMTRNGTAAFNDADALNSVTSLSGPTGAVLETYSYDSFGNLVAQTGSVANSLQYTGREFDQETNLLFYRARYYDASSGRFLSGDPIRYEAGMNFYAYVRDNPLVYNDPLGLYGWYDVLQAWNHYCWGPPTPWTANFDSINWGTTVLDVWGAIRAQAGGRCIEQAIPVNFTMAAQTAGADANIIGRHSVRVTGTLQMHCNCNWTFQGDMSSAQGFDTYTFHPSNRGGWGEFKNWIGAHRCRKGTPFEIYLPGNIPIMNSGTSGGKPTCCQ